jgi:hypothetical protein
LTGIDLFIQKKGFLDNWIGNTLALDLPVIVPSKQKALVSIHFKLHERDKSASSTQQDIQIFLKDPKRFWNQYESIVLLDKRNRYEIDFPLFQ